MTGSTSPDTGADPLPVVDLDDFAAWDELARASGWTDGLPVAPPTTTAVEAILDALPESPDPVGLVPPGSGVLTRQMLAVQCAMAGCRPEHAPVVLAAIQAMLDPGFNLYGVQCTTNPCAPLTIVSGPIVEELGFHGGDGSFGGGSHASAVVGRAIRLILWNVGDAQPGQPDMAALGHPGKYTFCVAENVEHNPWEPIHTDFGLPRDASCVTVFACQSPDAALLSGEAEEILGLLEASLPVPTMNMFHSNGQYMVTFNPRVAQELARGGFDRTRVRRWLFDHARYRVGTLRERGLYSATDTLRSYWGWRSDSGIDLETASDDTLLPMVKNERDIHVLVSGGMGQWWGGISAGWGDYGGYARSREIPR